VIKVPNNTKNDMYEDVCSANGEKTTNSGAPVATRRGISVTNQGSQTFKALTDGPFTFDPYNLPTGDASIEIWQHILTQFDAQLEEKGWDQPTTLFAIQHAEPPKWLRQAEKNGRLDKKTREILGRSVAGFRISKLFEMSCNPVEGIWGFDAPDWAGGLILAYEAWMVDPAADGAGKDRFSHLPPEDHPRRQEVRQLILLTRAGAQYSLTRRRGQDVQVSGNGQDHEFGGLIPGVLGRSLGLPPREPTRSVAEYLGCLTLNLSIEMARQFNGTPDPAYFDKAQLRRLRALSAEERHGLGSEFAVGIAFEMIREISERVLEADLSFMNAQTSVEPAELKKLWELARDAGEVSWNHFVEVAGDFLPSQVPDHTWAGESLFSQYVFGRYCPTQASLIAELKELLSVHDFEVVRDLCEGAGWLAYKD
jgi:hypothetical protein